MAGIFYLPKTEVPPNDLIMDDSNTRVAQLYSGNTQNGIIIYLL
jgi:hypothetical protein